MRLALAALLLAAPAVAAPLTPFVPGAGDRQCAGACSLEWAAREAGVPMGDARPVTIPAGSVVEWMSYATSGQPHGYRVAKVTARDEPGLAYVLPSGRVMARFGECGNWGVIHVPPGADMGAPGPLGPPLAAGPLFASGGGTRWTSPPPPWVIVPPEVETPETPPPAVPLPASGLLLLLGMGALVWQRNSRKV